MSSKAFQGFKMISSAREKNKEALENDSNEWSFCCYLHTPPNCIVMVTHPSALDLSASVLTLIFPQSLRYC
jgi:hypothetical protein